MVAALIPALWAGPRGRLVVGITLMFAAHAVLVIEALWLLDGTGPGHPHPAADWVLALSRPG